MEINNVFKCKVCGNTVELVGVGGGELVCCGQPMEKQTEKCKEEGLEKHKPVIKTNHVEVGSVPHPMEEGHYIMWIESIDSEDLCRVNLKPGEEPKAEFSGEVKQARAFCNVHGLWES